ncbi:MAG: T9SS type A sorting domain-containing protein, partial [Saprospiraceae bacterium]|nr:T9SS type A sorting domain-containing protein [Saprospiraceae bacterium]
ASNPLYTFPGPGTYNITLSSYDDCDTIVTSKSIIVIQTSLMEDNLFENLTFYPNPASDKIIIENEFESEISVCIFNVLKESLIKIDNLSTNEIDVSSLKSGLYLIQVNNGNESVTKKLLINK